MDFPKDSEEWLEEIPAGLFDTGLLETSAKSQTSSFVGNSSPKTPSFEKNDFLLYATLMKEKCKIIQQCSSTLNGVAEEISSALLSSTPSSGLAEEAVSQVNRTFDGCIKILQERQAEVINLISVRQEQRHRDIHEEIKQLDSLVLYIEAKSESLMKSSLPDSPRDGDLPGSYSRTPRRFEMNSDDRIDYDALCKAVNVAQQVTKSLTAPITINFVSQSTLETSLSSMCQVMDPRQSQLPPPPQLQSSQSQPQSQWGMAQPPSQSHGWKNTRQPVAGPAPKSMLYPAPEFVPKSTSLGATPSFTPSQTPPTPNGGYMSNAKMNPQVVLTPTTSDASERIEALFLTLSVFDGSTTPSRTTSEALRSLVRWANADRHPLAKAYVGLCYFYGFGAIRQDHELSNQYLLKAKTWVLESSVKGIKSSFMILGCCYEEKIGWVKEQDLVQALNWYFKAAYQGDKFSQCRVGHFLFEGKGMEANVTEAIRWYSSAAKNGNSEAQVFLGDCYMNGSGVTKDDNQALHWYTLAADQGNAMAQMAIGNWHSAASSNLVNAEGVEDASLFSTATSNSVADFDMKALIYYKKAAEKGLVQAQLIIGYTYENKCRRAKSGTESSADLFAPFSSDVCPADQHHNSNMINEALKWYRLAADQGSAVAQGAVRRLEEECILCPFSSTTASTAVHSAVHSQASSVGHSVNHSQPGSPPHDSPLTVPNISTESSISASPFEHRLNNPIASQMGQTAPVPGRGGYDDASIALVYRRFRTGEINCEVTLMQLAEDDQNRYPLAQGYAAISYFHGHGITIIRKDLKTARKYSRKALVWASVACRTGNVHAQCVMGMLFEAGLDAVQEDSVEAVRWYLLAASKGDAVAQTLLAHCYLKGRGTAKDRTEAFRWLWTAAQQGYALAQASLGLCYSKGDGIQEADPCEALYWQRLAAEQGLASAQRFLGGCYEHGKGTQIDLEVSAYWYNRAALTKSAATANHSNQYQQQHAFGHQQYVGHHYHQKQDLYRR